MYYPDKLIRVRPYQELYQISLFIVATMNSGFTRKFIEGEIKTTAGQQGISGASLKRAPIAIPSIAEAIKIGEILGDNLSQIDDLSYVISQEQAQTDALRQSILKAAFEGRLVPQDPTEEPASALLARIRGGGAAEPSPPRRRGRPPARP